jgi:hypothetical protein
MIILFRRIQEVSDRQILTDNDFKFRATSSMPLKEGSLAIKTFSEKFNE